MKKNERWRRARQADRSVTIAVWVIVALLAALLHLKLAVTRLQVGHFTEAEALQMELEMREYIKAQIEEDRLAPWRKWRE